MASRSAYAPGTFCWADLSTKDAEAAQRFYAGLLGWEYEGPIAMRDGAAVAAIAPMPPEAPHDSHWNSYIAVEDADATAARAAELGATVVERPFSIETAGRLALMHDPAGAAFCVWEAGDHPGAGLVNAPGALCWNHLETPDAEAAQRFYADLFGWSWNEGICSVGERMNGSAAASDDPPRWSVHFAVEDLERARAQVPELGGRELGGPMQAGPGSFVVVADPAGATLCLYAGELDE